MGCGFDMRSLQASHFFMFLNSLYKVSRLCIAYVLQNDLEQYGNDRWIEILSKKDYPILQIELLKSDNAIKINGLFFSERGYTIMCQDGIMPSSFAKPFMLMTAEEKNAIHYEALKKAQQFLVKLHDPQLKVSK